MYIVFPKYILPQEKNIGVGIAEPKLVINKEIYLKKCPKCDSENIEKGHLNNTAIDTNNFIGYFSETHKKFINIRKSV